MRVVEVTAFGGPEVLAIRQVPDPVAGAGQVVVGVSAADVLFVETQIRRGLHGKYFTVTPPYVPGGAVAGTVLSVGPEVDAGWVGRSVVAHTGGGGYAERVRTGVDALLAVPGGLRLPEAAALMHDGPTALTVFGDARIRPGEWALVTAAGGGMGILLVQLTHAAGARVIAAARGERKLAVLRTLGADFVVDYAEPGWANRVREATGEVGPAVVLDGAGGEIGRTAYELIADGGRFSAHGAPGGGFTTIDPQDAQRRGVTVRGIQDVQLAPEALRQTTERALSAAVSGRIRPVIGQTFPLDRAAEAHAAIEARTVIGKTLLTV